MNSNIDIEKMEKRVAYLRRVEIFLTILLLAILILTPYFLWYWPKCFFKGNLLVIQGIFRLIIFF